MAHAAAIETGRRMMSEIVAPPPKRTKPIRREPCTYTDCGSDETIRKRIIVTATGKRVFHYCKNCNRHFSVPFYAKPPPEGNRQWRALTDHSSAPEYTRRKGETDKQYWNRLFAEIDALNAEAHAQALAIYTSKRA